MNEERDLEGVSQFHQFPNLGGLDLAYPSCHDILSRGPLRCPTSETDVLEMLKLFDPGLESGVSPPHFFRHRLADEGGEGYRCSASPSIDARDPCSLHSPRSFLGLAAYYSHMK